MRIKNKIYQFVTKNKPQDKPQPIIIQTNTLQNGSSLLGKTAIIFGGTGGIGKAIAKRLLAEQCKVIVVGRKDLNEEGLFVEKFDVTNILCIYPTVEELIKKYGRIDIVINSHGICPEVDFEQNFYSIDFEDFERVVRTNLESVFFICQAFCRYFEKEKIKGHILNISSTEGLKGSVVPYGISKAGLVSLTKGLGKIMIKKNIIINGIAPGATATSMMKMNEKQDLRLNYLPSGRATTPKEVAELAYFLVSDSGIQLCGQVVCIDGGESLH